MEQAQPPEHIILWTGEGAEEGLVSFVEEKLHISPFQNLPQDLSGRLVLLADREGLALWEGGRALRGDFSRLLPRLIPNNLNHELLIRAARFRKATGPLTAVDATAGLGEDAFLLAGAGFSVSLYERDPVIALLLWDALRRGRACPDTAPVLERMELHMADSVAALPRLALSPDLVLLDPMFPQRQKSGLIKKKFQLLHLLEQPCQDEEELLEAALACSPRKIVIKRPAKGPCLAGRKPSYSLRGGSIRYDCLICPGREGP